MTRPFYAEHIENDADYAWIVENPVYAWSRYGESGDPRDLAMMFAVLAEAKLSEEDGYGLFYRNDGHGGGYVSQYVEENRDAVNGVFAMMLTDPRYSNQAFKAVAGSYVRNGPKRIYNHVMPGYAVDALLTRTAQLTTEDFKNADAMTHAAFIAGVIHAAEESAR